MHSSYWQHTHTLIVAFWVRSLHLPSIGCSREWESEWSWEGPCDEEKGGWEKANSSALREGGVHEEHRAWGSWKEGAIQQRREGTPDWMGPAVPWWSMGQVLGFSHCSESFFYSLCLCISLRTVCSCSYSLALCLMHHLGCVLALALIHLSVLLDSADVAVCTSSVHVYAASAWDLCCLQMLLGDEQWGENGILLLLVIIWHNLVLQLGCFLSNLSCACKQQILVIIANYIVVTPGIYIFFININLSCTSHLMGIFEGNWWMF